LHAQRDSTSSPPASSELRIALVIGNAAYKDAPLRNPTNDAVDVATALRELGWKVTLRTNASQRQMKDSIRQFGSELTRGGVGLFYFAGHGIQYRGENYLVPIGASIEREADVEDETVGARYLLTQLEEARNRVNIVIMDACRNNPYTRGFRSVSRGLAQMDAAQGTLVAFATAPGSVAADGEGRNGVYTKHLLRQIRQSGVPVELMFKRVRDGVIKETEERQTPWESSSLRGADFYFRATAAGTVAGPSEPIAPAAVHSTAIELAFWESIKTSTNRTDFEEYLRRYPDGHFVGLARNRIQSITIPVAVAAPSALTNNLRRSEEIKIGNINPYSGPASAYGTIGKSIGAYFRKVNDEGGVNGRVIRYISYDDGYSPPKTVEMARKLVEQDEVLLILQSLGTPPNSAIHKYMNARKVPQLFVASGATKWNDPRSYPWTMGWQPSYHTEGAIYAQHIIKTRPNARIAILYQNDDYGKDYLKGFKDGLSTNTHMIVSELSYEVTDPTVDSQVVQLQASGADVFFNITTPKFAAQAIRRAFDSGWKPVHYLNNVSASVGSVLTPAGLDKSVGLISTQYLKDPTDKAWAKDPAVIEWTAFMKKYYPDGNLSDAANFYGWAVAQTMVHVLKQAGENLTRENVMRQAANLKDFVLAAALPGIRINTSQNDFAPFESVQLIQFDGRQWNRFGEVMGK